MGEWPKLLVGACLLGGLVRYDGSAKTLHNALLDRWRRDGRVLAVCPELLAGFPTPRPSAEISGTRDGSAVLEGRAEVMQADGAVVTSRFVQGAFETLDIAVGQGCRFALLTDGSLFCASTSLHDGSFTDRRRMDEGVTAALLRRHGVAVFSPDQMDEPAAVMEA